MSKHRPEVTLWQMLDAVDQVKALRTGKGREDLGRDAMFRLAMERLVTIIGEAVTRLPESLTEKYPAVPWVAIRGARNVIMHGYDGVDEGRLWDIIHVQIDELGVLIQGILTNENWPKPH